MITLTNHSTGNPTASFSGGSQFGMATGSTANFGYHNPVAAPRRQFARPAPAARPVSGGYDLEPAGWDFGPHAGSGQQQGEQPGVVHNNYGPTQHVYGGQASQNTFNAGPAQYGDHFSYGTSEGRPAGDMPAAAGTTAGGLAESTL